MKLPFILAKRFVAGESLDTAIPPVITLNKKNIAVSLDLLGENVKDRATADRTTEEYDEIMHHIHKQELTASISIKLTMLGLDIDEDYTIRNLFRLLDTAKSLGQFIRIDMEGSDYTEATIRIFKQAHERYGAKHIGIVIQAYLKRTRKDIEDLAALNADIRLCKGAYKEPASLALQSMKDIRKAYLEYAKILLEKTSYPRFASHDDELISALKQYTTEQKIDSSRFEFQMLYGLRPSTWEELVAAGYNMRVYVPYGTMWFPYFSRRLAERKENIFFVLSALMKG